MSILHSTRCALVHELTYRGLLHQLTSSADLSAPSHRKRERGGGEGDGCGNAKYRGIDGATIYR